MVSRRMTRRVRVGVSGLVTCTPTIPKVKKSMMARKKTCPRGVIVIVMTSIKRRIPVPTPRGLDRALRSLRLRWGSSEGPTFELVHGAKGTKHAQQSQNGEVCHTCDRERIHSRVTCITTSKTCVPSGLGLGLRPGIKAANPAVTTTKSNVFQPCSCVVDSPFRSLSITK